jgi:hypothetical protein
MKDAVKITVIATGFKESDMRRMRHHENYDPVIISREASRHGSHQLSRDDDPFDEPVTAAEPEPVFVPESSYLPHPAPVAFQESEPGGGAHAEVISLEAMRGAVPSYQAEDLDVPAFLRKRSEVM